MQRAEAGPQQAGPTRTMAILIGRDFMRFINSVVVMMAEGLRSLSIEPVILHELPRGFAGRAIILDTHYFDEESLSALGGDSIVLNMENSGSKWINDEYLRILKKFIVWDYNKVNAEAISAMISKPVHYLRMFYVRPLTRIDHRIAKDIDVLFYGSFNDRRSHILDQLRAKGLVVAAVFGVFGAELDGLIARAKVVINIHYYDNGRMEIVRLFDLFANRCAVASELNPGEFFDEDLRNGLAAAPYDELADIAEWLVADAVARERHAHAGFEALQRRHSAPLLGKALQWSDVSLKPSGCGNS